MSVDYILKLIKKVKNISNKNTIKTDIGCL